MTPDAIVRLAAGPSLPTRWRARRQRLTSLRFVIVDVETTGPDRERDRMVSLGAVGVVHGALRLVETFGAVLRQGVESGAGSILLHRIGEQRQREGEAPRLVLERFLEFRGDAVGVAFRAPFDEKVLEREIGLTLGLRARMRLIDLAELLPAFFPGTTHATLDAWCAHFGLEAVARHDALGDAFVTAQLFLIVLSAAEQTGVQTLGDLLAVERGRRWLPRHR